MNERQIVHVNNGSLILRKILQSDAGIYNCTVVAIPQLDHKFKSNNKRIRGKEGGRFYSENNKNSQKVKKNEQERHDSNTRNGFKFASSSMRIRVIGKKTLIIRIILRRRREREKGVVFRVVMIMQFF